MKIGVISDTHIPERALDLPSQIYEAFKEVDLIIHAGDVTELKLLQKMEQITKKEVKAVLGNMDSIELKALLPQQEEIELCGFKIGIIHGTGQSDTVVNFVKSQFKGREIDVIIFGHSHTALNRRENGVLLFNPGSPTDKIFSPCLSYGILYVDEKIRGEIVKITD